jgi:hypothetical protein
VSVEGSRRSSTCSNASWAEQALSRLLIPRGGQSLPHPILIPSEAVVGDAIAKHCALSPTQQSVEPCVVIKKRSAEDRVS